MGHDGLVEEDLRSLYGHPRPLVAEAWAGELEATTRAFINASPVLLLSSVNSEGFIDMSPRGGEPGFVEIVDNTHIRFLDQLGNRKLHTFSNLADNNRIGLCFMIPGVKEVLRAYGKASVSDNASVIEAMGGTINKNKVVINIHLTKVFPHCSNALNRAGLWVPETWRDAKEANIPSLLAMAESLAQSRGP